MNKERTITARNQMTERGMYINKWTAGQIVDIYKYGYVYISR